MGRDRDEIHKGNLVILIDPETPVSQTLVATAWEGRPCQGGALKKAFESLDEGDYVALVASRNHDWTRATIWVGPMASEYGEAITVEWQGGEYEVTESKELQGYEMPPRQTEVVE